MAEPARSSFAPNVTVVVLDLRGAERPRSTGGGPLAVVCGVPVIVRTLLVLARHGCKKAVLLVEPEDHAHVSAVLARHARLELACTIRADAGDSLGSAAEGLRDVPGSAGILCWPATLSFGRLPPWPAEGSGLPWPATAAARQTIAFVSRKANSDEAGADEAGANELELCRPMLVLTTASVIETHARLSVTELVAHQAQRGELIRASLPVPPIAVVDRGGARQAERALLRSLRKDADGVVARFDRHVSLAISRRLMAFPVKPNQVTLFAAAVGVFCGVLVARGGYLPMLLGAIGFELNSILDGVDGEIARAKLLESPAGQWFDTLADDLSNLAFMIGVSVGSYRTWGAPLYLGLGAVSTVGFLIASALMYHYLITRAHSGDLNDFALPWEEGREGRRDLRLHAQGAVSRVIARIKWVSRRDVYVFLCVLCGIAGQLRIMAWLFALGSTISWATIFTYRGLIPLWQRRARQSADRVYE